MARTLLIFFVFLIFFLLAFMLIILIVVIIRRKSRNRLGDYIEMEMIGKGGMSIIYRAKNRILKRYVAVKVMDEIMMKDRDLVHKFLSEGRNIAIINKKYPDSPVVKVLEYSDHESDPPYFIAMEYLEGMSVLKKMKTNQKPDLYTRLHIIKEVARALQAAHSLHIIHRDIAPDNIIINGRTVTLIDFGIAKQEFSNYRTQSGAIVGKPLYMSPEQCADQKITSKSDIYSLGAVLFFLLEEKPMYDSRNPYEILKMHRDCNQPPEVTKPLPGDLKDFLKRMLDKDPRNRPDATDVVKKMVFIMKTEELNKWQ